MAGGVAVFPALLGPGELAELSVASGEVRHPASEQISEPLGQSVRATSQASAGAPLSGEQFG